MGKEEGPSPFMNQWRMRGWVVEGSVTYDCWESWHSSQHTSPFKEILPLPQLDQEP